MADRSTDTDAGTAPGYIPPSPTHRYEILRDARSLALVGASSNPSRASYFVASYLVQDTDYDLSFVNPRATEILGVPAYASLRDLPSVPDVVVAFRRSEELPALAREVVELGAKVLWIQLGLWSEEAAAIAREGGVDVVMDRCIKIEHARFHGGLHLGGFNTGVISSRLAQVPGQRRRLTASVADGTAAVGAAGATAATDRAGVLAGLALVPTSTIDALPPSSPLVCELPHRHRSSRD
ncbi:MAG: CoA-binding protein [Actinomyces sp.]|jgi:predicted CoA-binding protein|nr:CoA-binding protein [Actinomyces sp.]MCI1642500.1 CoA-binding protein [Actinomyces sp.]MCI1663067.1 CoA-binding protein [Actinomyces sp.]MCI1691705.1 CoA-binding protein [Actinomyces sp.]